MSPFANSLRTVFALCAQLHVVVTGLRAVMPTLLAIAIAEWILVALLVAARFLLFEH